MTLKTKKRLSKVLPLTLTIDAAGLGLAAENDVWRVTAAGATANDALPLDESRRPSAHVVDALLSAGFLPGAAWRRRGQPPALRLRRHR